MYISKHTKKSVNQASITATSIKNMPLPDVSLEAQNSIVKRMNKIQSLIDMEFQQIQKLDILKQSLIQEYFD